MASSTSNLDLLTQGQAGKEITVNALADAASPAMLYGRRQSASSGLTWGFYGGAADLAGTPTLIANGSLTLTASATNYIVALKSTGVVSASTATTNWNSVLYWRLYSVVTGASTVTSYLDYRMVGAMDYSRVAALAGSSAQAFGAAGLKVSEAVNAKQGVATLVAGAVTVSNTSITANSRIFLTSQEDGGTAGFLRVTARAIAASFTITSSSATDTSLVAYEVFEPT